MFFLTHAGTTIFKGTCRVQQKSLPSSLTHKAPSFLVFGFLPVGITLAGNGPCFEDKGMAIPYKFFYVYLSDRHCVGSVA